MKIIPVSSGKGGVGKTTLALNLALTLARNYSTVLIDLDSGTSSVRNFINMEVNKDIYHFLKKGQPINQCLLKLNKSIDPENEYTNFSFLAAPKDYVYDIINFNPQVKMRLIDGINSLKADFVILDLRAGIDQNITDFIPFNNSGILVFTPKIQAASFTAAELVKASIIRVFRTILENKEYCINNLLFRNKELDTVELLTQTIEDSYDADENSIYQILTTLKRTYRNNKLLSYLIKYVKDYKIYYVLNHFNSIDESIRGVIGPFVDQISKRIFKSLMIRNLGWIIYENDIMKSSQNLIPYLLFMFYKNKRQDTKEDEVNKKLREILGVSAKTQTNQEEKMVDDLFEDQLNLLKNMYIHEKGKDAVSNFIFIKKAILFIMESTIHNFGLPKLLHKTDLLDAFHQKYVKKPFSNI